MTRSSIWTRMTNRRIAAKSSFAVTLLSILAISITGCGTGGYAGGGLTSLSVDSVTMDASQSFNVSAAMDGVLPVDWTLQGNACSGAACGTVAQPMGSSNTYTAPANITTSIAVTLQAMVQGTNHGRTVAITVNPAPAITGTTPGGSVGVPYAATLKSSGGTGTLTVSLKSGSLPDGLSFDPASGIITGTPTATGSFAFTVQVVDQAFTPFTVTASRVITIASDAAGPGPGSPSTTSLTITNGTPVSGTVAVPYTYTLAATGGTAPYAWSLVSGTLPNGLTLLPNGTIAGLPTVAGTSNFIAKVQDSTGTSVQANMSITIAPVQLGLLISALPNGTVNVPYSATIGVSGGTAPFTCSVVSGTLPNGLTLNNNCSVTGTPMVAGPFAFVVKATDSGNPAQVVTGPVAIVIAPTGLNLLISVLPNGTVNVPYSATIGVAGGTAPYTCSLVSGTLPSGLTLNNNCSVTGTPTTAQIEAFTVRATDSGNPAQVTTGLVTVTIVPTPLNLSLSVLPNGTVRVPYSATITVGGGTAPYTCSLVSGTLPSGLTLNNNCSVTGTPTTAQVEAFTVRATDSGNPAQVTTGLVTVTIVPTTLNLSLSVLPNGTVSVPYSATITVGGGTAPYSCSLTGGTIPAGLTLNSNCTVTGTPTAASVNALTVKAVDSGNPSQMTTGVVTITIVPATLGLSISVLPNGVVTHPYSATITVGGGVAPYTCALTGGTLPAGLTLNNDCTVTGTPTVVTTSVLTVRATDGGNPAQVTTGAVNLTIAPLALNIGVSVLPNGTVGVPYNSTISVGGGVAPYTCALVGGSMPAGLTLNANCSVTGTPALADVAVLNVKATDSEDPAQSTTNVVNLTIVPATLGLSISALPNGTVNQPYSATISVGGGTGPFTCTLVGGTVPTGLTLNPNCTVTGTPTTPAIAALNVRVVDSGNPVQNTTGIVALTIAPEALNITISVLPNATVNQPYSATLTLAGGAAPYACTLVGGTLPTGLALNSNCTITGTATTPIAATALVVRATDSSNPVQNTTATVALTVLPAQLAITVSVLPNGTVDVPYSATIGVGGGVAPYTCALTGGILPIGLTLNNNCTITGTPTAAAISALTIRVTDSTSPTPQIVTAVVALTVSPASLGISITTLPNGTVGTAYSATITGTGGTAPYICSLASGSFPAGLTLGANCTVTGTPTSAGFDVPVVRITDSGSPAQNVTGLVAITIAPQALSFSVSVLPNATTNTPYSATIALAGGTQPYSCSLVSGTVPAGLTLNSNCTITGTPIAAVAAAALSVKATDADTPAQNTAATVVLTVLPLPLSINLSVLPNGVVGTPYSATVAIGGGVAPYTCALTGGVMPGGLTLNNNCTITGTPTAPAIGALIIRATDSATPTASNTTATVVLTVTGTLPTLTVTSPANAQLGQAYTGTIGVTGGTAPYTCTVTYGTLPAGLSINNCSITGTATAAGSSTIGIMVSDATTPTARVGTGNITVTVQPAVALALTGTLPNATLNAAYNQTLTATGGLAPYTYSITAGALPAGLSLSTSGVVSGTPTTVGASSFTVTVSDSQGTPATASLPLVLMVAYTATVSDALMTGHYAFLFQGYDDVAAGVLAYQTATVGSFTADGTGNITTGELDSNSQLSTPTENTVPSNNFIGTYTIGADGRGTAAFTVLNEDGTTAATTVMAIALKLTAAPATEGSMIAFENNDLQGVKGNGMLLRQDTTAMAAGLNGSYAFGISGDTPCLPSCSVGIVAGPVATVGRFTASGSVVSGTADANVASTNHASASISGNYVIPDANGRLVMTMNNSLLSATPYPVDYAVYVIDASHAFLVSTDKHSDYILQAGTATLQTVSNFTNAQMASRFVGYENAPVNPGLVGQVLGSTLNLGSATIFEAQGNGTGTCTTNAVDVGGLTGLINTLTGLGSNTAIPEALLDTYQSLGDSACTVAGNGRAVLNYPAPSGLVPTLLATLGLAGTPPAPRVAYLTGASTGYFLETGYAALGRMEAQTGTFSTATLNGTYVYQTAPASSLVTIDNSGTFTADGAGNTSQVLDENVGVGTINLLQTAVTSTTTYSLTDANIGRYLLGTSRVIYAIAPGRFVLMETNPLSTAPFIATLY